MKKGSAEAKAWGERMRALRYASPGRRTRPTLPTYQRPSRLAPSQKAKKYSRRKNPATHFRVSLAGGRWKYFDRLEDAKAYAEHIRQRTGTFSAIEHVKKRSRNNPKSFTYTGTIKLPTYVESAVARVLYEGPKGIDWVWFHQMSPENKQHFGQFIVSIQHPLAYEAGTQEWRFKQFVRDVMNYIQPSENPGAAWHEQRAREADSFDRQMRQGKKPHLAMFYHGKEVAHNESAMAARAMGENPLAIYGVANPGRSDGYFLILRKRDGAGLVVNGEDVQKFSTRSASKAYLVSGPYSSRKVAVDLFKGRGNRSNPPKHINSAVAGTVYNRALEVRAEKTAFQPGYWKHKFFKRSGVKILALDNGDLLLHSTKGKPLWKRA